MLLEIIFSKISVFILIFIDLILWAYLINEMEEKE